MGLVKSRIQIKWSGNTTVSAKGWTITITSTWGGWWDTLWTRKNDTTIQPSSNTDDVSVWSGNITFKASLGINNTCTQPQTYNYYPAITFNENLIIKHGDLIECATNYIHINQNWIWIGTEPNGTYRLNVNWGARMTNLTVNSYANISSATIGSHQFTNTKVWINWSTTQDNDANLQVHGAISIDNNFSSAPTSSTPCTAWSIAYRDGTFYGCTNNNTWKIFNMSDISGWWGWSNNWSQWWSSQWSFGWDLGS